MTNEEKEEEPMLRKFLICDICGDKWDITNTDYADKVDPGEYYNHNKVREGCRQFRIQKMEVKSDDRMYFERLDLCDKCYNKLDRFIYELAKGEINADF